MALTWLQLKTKFNTFIGNDIVLRGDKHNEIMTDVIDSLDTKASKTTTVNGQPLSANVVINANNLGLGNVDNTSDINKPISTAQQTLFNLKADLVGGKVPSSQLPSFVDDVIEVANYAALPGTGETGKIYITLDTNLTYRWSGSVYTEISASLALGETSGSAYRGDRGKIAYDHSQNKSTDVDADMASTTKWASVKATYDWAMGLFEKLSNKASNFTVIDDVKYPTTKAVFNFIPCIYMDIAPTVNDDDTKGFISGLSRAIVKADKLQYICRSNAAGAAVWEIDSSQLVPFKITANQAHFYAGLDLFITECPQPPLGYAWVSSDLAFKYSGATVGYNGEPQIDVMAYGADKHQFSDESFIWGTLGNFAGFFKRLDISGVANNITVLPWDGVPGSNIGALVLSFGGAPSTVGDGILTVYGKARLIKL